MPIVKELPLAFPWYENNINLQNRFRENAKNLTTYGLISPADALLPFEFYRTGGSTVITSWQIYTAAGALVITLNALNHAKIKNITLEGRTYFYYDGSALFNLPGHFEPGEYYSRILFNDATEFFSEVFLVPSCSFLTTSQPEDVPFLRLEWYNESDIRPIFYNDYDTDGIPYFKNILFLDTFIHVSEPEIIEEGERDGNGDTVPTFVKGIRRYRLAEMVPDFLKVALVLMQMHDKISLTTPFGHRTGEILKMTTNTQTEQGGAFSVVEIVFEEDLAMIKKGCADNMGTAAGPPPPPPPPPVQTFDTILTFEASVEDNEAGVGGTVGAIDSVMKFEFNAIAPLSGTPADLEIRVSGITVIVLAFMSDYIGKPYRFTDALGAVRYSTFHNGTKDF
jgi:hypothetical protein